MSVNKEKKKYGKITEISAPLAFLTLPMEGRYILKLTVK
jgi:hypothetical protein